MTPDADRCLVCDHDHTMNGFICVLCFRARVHTRHWRWLDARYVRAVETEAADLQRTRKEAA